MTKLRISDGFSVVNCGWDKVLEILSNLISTSFREGMLRAEKINSRAGKQITQEIQACPQPS